MRFSWRRKKHIALTTRAFIRRNFNDDGEYTGDNPYLSGCTITSLLMRWHRSGRITDTEYMALLREYT